MAVSPGTILKAAAAGHAAWGVLAYGGELAEVLGDLPAAVGDGILNKEHSGDRRAAGFWFLVFSPSLLALGCAWDAIERAGDQEAMATLGRITTTTAVAGALAVPTSPFPGAIGVGLWMLGRSRAVGAPRT